MTIVITVLLAITVNVSSQEVREQKIHGTSEYYMQKSIKQKQTGNMFLILGGVAVGVGGTMALLFDDFTTLGVAVITIGAGAALTIASIPFYVAAGNNKRKAKSMSASFKIDNNSSVITQRWTVQRTPALSLKIHL